MTALEPLTVTLMTAAVRPLPSAFQQERRGRAARTDEIVDLLRTCTVERQETLLRDELIHVNMAVARAVATSYRARGIPLDDLEQIAYLALTKAGRRFDPSAGFAFLSFAVPTIKGEVRRYFRDNGWMVRPPRRIQELQARVTHSTAELSMRLGRPPSAREVAEHLGEALDEVLEAMDGAGCFSPTSLDSVVGDGTTTLGELIGVDEADVRAAEARIVLAPAVRRLGERDRRIIAMRFFDDKTQSEIADVIGVTQMQISRVLARIYRQLREAMGTFEEPEDHGVESRMRAS